MERINLRYWPDKDIQALKPSRFVERELSSALLHSLDSDKVKLLFGPRQGGKSSLMGWLVHRLIQRGVDKSRINYVSLDFFDLHPLVSDTRRLLRLLREEGGNSGKIYLFIDEIQRLKNAGLVLKQIHDLKRNVSVVASGSSSLGIREKVKEALTGRKEEFTLYPFSFLEFLRARETLPAKRLVRFKIDDLEEVVALYGNRLLRHWQEFVLLGGYPEIVLFPERRDVLCSSLFSVYLEKDVGVLISSGLFQKFQDFVRLLSSEVGRTYNRETISRVLGVSRKSLEKFEDILLTTFVVLRLTPFYTNVRKELSKMPRFYFVDTGLRNFLVGESRSNAVKGFLMENAVVAEVLKVMHEWTLHWWKSKGGAEVDLVLRKGNTLVPIEIKGALRKKSKVTRSFASFVDRYHPQIALFITLSEYRMEKRGDTSIYFLPPYALGLMEDL